ncbi:MAG: excinuclease ABC subunit B [Candidatus Kerfeldbacteria bacterium CG_4_10_14_0_8_um_filter_42_10]|uniref:UvrABC system protein B n=1 Tax=Candidatus Kerfeldbacteria bacterium CG_4_10_14_0_8_um_filter_42_10 TaxID=2014248 RepID=A0A2M7RGN9_9BACT|nr:MAG: excinuclease ABC subunit B [Candidatus Kerfeldbacteria bacterium CG_4_10_14_0_8_um_filter_42_10]
MNKFKLQSKFRPKGDQPRAIDQLVKGLAKKYRDQTLLGVTGSGKTFTMANIITQVQKPTLVISHNKTLAAQLASEFRDFFPKNEVHYFVSYYDYYQPEAYLPTTDTYIEKETDINEEIDRLRHASTQSLISRKDVIIVASVSCIYGLGAPEEYQKEGIFVSVGAKINRKRLLENLVKIQYQRNNHYLDRGKFRIKGEVIEIFPIYSEQNAYQIQMWGDKIEQIKEIDSLTGETVQNLKEVMIFPTTHYLVPFDKQELAFKNIKADLKEQVGFFEKQNKLIEAQRIEQRTRYDLEMIKETGYCNGIENYSRYFDGRKPGQPPYTLLDYFPKDFLMFIDESHMTVPQIRGMYEGDRARKNILVEYGFRLPAARDNRPLTFAEFDQKINQVIYVSATPMEYEKKKSKQIAEQLIRPTGLLDPTIELKPTQHQIDDLLDKIQQRVKRHQRVLVTVLTKRMAEELSEYLKEVGIAVHYLHSEIDTFERLEILRDLRLGTYDVVVGINLLREGLDLPEVSLIAILDADKEGFLRSDTALIQTMGRAARHQEGHIIMYADKITDSMKRAIAETKRRRKSQEIYNQKHHITPQSIQKAIKEERLAGAKLAEKEVLKLDVKLVPPDEINHLIKDLKNQMELAAKNLEFEKAAIIRDQIKELKKS